MEKKTETIIWGAGNGKENGGFWDSGFREFEQNGSKDCHGSCKVHYGDPLLDFMLTTYKVSWQRSVLRYISNLEAGIVV